MFGKGDVRLRTGFGDQRGFGRFGGVVGWCLLPCLRFFFMKVMRDGMGLLFRRWLVGSKQNEGSKIVQVVGAK